MSDRTALQIVGVWFCVAHTPGQAAQVSITGGDSAVLTSATAPEEAAALEEEVPQWHCSHLQQNLVGQVDLLTEGVPQSSQRPL